MPPELIKVRVSEQYMNVAMKREKNKKKPAIAGRLR
jgi:hypothetical protein